MAKTLRLILGDQLNSKHSWFQKNQEDYTYVLMECRSETDYVTHHIQKVLGFFAAMRAFAAHLSAEGHHMHYIKLNDEHNKSSIASNVEALIDEHGFERFEYQLPDEWRLDRALKELCERLSIPCQAYNTEHFYTHRNELKEMFADRKQLVMEYFYRNMRKKHDVMMVNGEPITGQWNYDASNRKKLPKDWTIEPPLVFSHDLSAIAADLERAGVETIGNVDASNFIWPIDREESVQLLQHFLKVCFRYFGDYQDAMSQEEWSLYHARISFSLNLKILSPKEVVDAAVEYWHAHQEEVDISQLEGFVRQIIGWREFMRGIYWWKMPEFAEMNFFEHERPLPKWFWTGETKMACMRQAVKGSLDHAYAHHIQRLMLTGNFALLAGCDPNEVDQWYLGIYIDAIEWVEITNTRGMSQYADGGIVGTKPYVSGGSYVHKMGDHCKHCHYDYKKKTGQGACPLNSLYWHFHARNREKLGNNPRISMMYRTWDKMDKERQAAYMNQAEHYLSKVDYI